MNFESVSYAKNEKKEEAKDLWGRVSEEALEIFSKERNEESLEKAKRILSDFEFKKSIKGEWDRQILSETADNDSEKQEKLWARGLAMKLKEKLDN